MLAAPTIAAWVIRSEVDALKINLLAARAVPPPRDSSMIQLF